MADLYSPAKRSQMMAKVKSRDTKPEMFVRKTLHSLGFRYRLHVKSLAGKPDIVLSKYRAAIFVNGCFWHGHECKKGRLPSTNVDFWAKKIKENKLRDEKTRLELRGAGWNVIVLWECSLPGPEKLVELLHNC